MYMTTSTPIGNELHFLTTVIELLLFVFSSFGKPAILKSLIGESGASWYTGASWYSLVFQNLIANQIFPFHI